jgi:hypothetical protein
LRLACLSLKLDDVLWDCNFNIFILLQLVHHIVIPYRDGLSTLKTFDREAVNLSISIVLKLWDLPSMLLRDRLWQTGSEELFQSTCILLIPVNTIIFVFLVCRGNSSWVKVKDLMMSRDSSWTELLSVIASCNFSIAIVTLLWVSHL